ncbi:hypothetical protein SAMN05880582_101301 [Rhizobium sp. RU20A]|uniref:hypothetical protein n=1 Tax=Rhizobium sp. RU20A TaxID=1907412 RepID=UPI0009553BEC|nr:hypothetical protein [Rhizobium sp. RU20A]SIP99156.1 hypothetical protein SAMN05880582_101301 [Rhizobium sp. RU20A]
MWDGGAMGRGIARVGAHLLIICIGSLYLLDAGSLAFAACPERPACRGCGCKGGPGYRGPGGRCVGFKALDKVCGIPPETRCTFENARGTGENKACALGGDDTNKAS